MGPVKREYWRKTLRGLGPNITNTSMIPLSENQCVSTCGVSPADLKNDISFVNIVYSKVRVKIMYQSQSIQ